MDRLQARPRSSAGSRTWVDAFFMHVQGQGRVQFDDGTPIRLSYSGKIWPHLHWHRPCFD